MNFWVPLILEQGMDPVYSECRCSKCGFDSVYHKGVPCEKYSCPKCGEKMEKVREPEEVDEGKITKTKSGVVRLPDGSGFFVGTVKTKKRIRK